MKQRRKKIGGENESKMNELINKEREKTIQQKVVNESKDKRGKKKKKER